MGRPHDYISIRKSNMEGMKRRDLTNLRKRKEDITKYKHTRELSIQSPRRLYLSFPHTYLYSSSIMSYS